MTRRRDALAWLALLLIVFVGLHAASGGALSTPAVTSSTGWSSWLSRTDPVVAAFALVRLLGLFGAWYALAATVLAALSRLSGSGALIAVCDRLTLPLLRQLVAATLSASVATGGLGAMAARAGAQPAESQATVVMHRLPDAAAVPEAPSPLPPPAVANPPGEWRVAPGQCFWTIADDVLTAAWGREPSDAEIVPYWQRLIEANLAVLSDRGNPDLIFPGQIFTVPAP